MLTLEELKQVFKEEEELEEEQRTMKTFEELKQEREELLEKARKAMHAPDPFNNGYNAMYANCYSKKANEILKQMCIAKGIDPKEIL